MDYLKNKNLNLILGSSFAIGISLFFLIRHRKKVSQQIEQNELSEANKLIGAIEVIDLPIIDLNIYLNQSVYSNEVVERECEKVANALHEFGVLIVRDPRVNEQHNDTFIDLMERYFESSDGVKDARPQYSYQVGVTPERRELPRNHCTRMKQYSEENKPLSLCPPEFDPKWRFFWRLGEKPKKSAFMTLNPDPVIPQGFSEWETVMNMWGYKMLSALEVVAAMLSHGLGFDDNLFPDLMKFAPHLLAPTGSDFNKYGKLHTVLAGYHYDLNFLTIHGKSRFPGLYIWTKNGKKVRVSVPDGCLLVQAGKQIEYFTGGYILAGFHEVVVAPETVQVIAKKKKRGESLWRVSSTCFGHIASDQIAQPLDRFATTETLRKYPPKPVGQLVQEELDAISLGKS